MIQPGHRSPLLSTLGIVALAGAVAPACRDDGGPAPIDDVADVFEIYEDLYGFYCECYGELYAGAEGAEECLAEADIASDAELACMREVFDANPPAFEVLRCQAEALRGFVGCQQAEGCPASFMCSDGTAIPEEYVCDGFPECSDGADEQQNCPPAFMCDGQPLEQYSVCDGFEDCADGSDEQGCPAPFMCGDGTEVPPEWVCDGASDCEDGTDEQQMCPVTCESQYDTRSEACGDVSDEVQMLLSECFDYECFDGQTIAGSQECDGTADCAEGEDESFCPDMGAGG